MRDISIVHSNRRCFNHYLCRLGLGVLLGLLWGLGLAVHVTGEGGSAFCFVLCVWVNFPATVVATCFFVLHAMALHLSIICCHEDAFAMELGVLQTTDVALKAGNDIHRLTIVDESYSSHDKEKEQCLSLCIVLNLGVSKLPSLPLQQIHLLYSMHGLYIFVHS